MTEGECGTKEKHLFHYDSTIHSRAISSPIRKRLVPPPGGGRSYNHTNWHLLPYKVAGYTLKLVTLFFFSWLRRRKRKRTKKRSAVKEFRALRRATGVSPPAREKLLKKFYQNYNKGAVRTGWVAV